MLTYTFHMVEGDKNKPQASEGNEHLTDSEASKIGERGTFDFWES